MTCPVCGGKTKVVETRMCYLGFSVLRERRCDDCHLYFKTEELLMGRSTESRDRWSKSHRNKKENENEKSN